ncbi:MAG: VWA domain-containing protein [Planctomycetes bacterium]|nr:VWA domain-containing protein [Planctomycetota bacterium]
MRPGALSIAGMLLVALLGRGAPVFAAESKVEVQIGKVQALVTSKEKPRTELRKAIGSELAELLILVLPKETPPAQVLGVVDLCLFYRRADPDPWLHDKMAEILEQLRDTHGDLIADHVRKGLKNEPDWRVRDWIVRLVASLAPPDRFAFFSATWDRDVNPYVRETALEMVGEHGLRVDENQVDAIMRVIGDAEQDWQRHVAAIRALAKAARQSAAPVTRKAAQKLAAQVAEAEWSPRQRELVAALRRLTGAGSLEEHAPFQRRAEYWRRVMEFDSRNRPLADLSLKGLAPTPGPTLFGRPIVERRALFLVDISESMLAPLDRGDVDKVAREHWADVPAARVAETKTRLDAVCLELERAVNAAPGAQGFTVVVFAETAAALDLRFLSTNDDRAKLIARLANVRAGRDPLRPGGISNLAAALDRCLALDTSGTETRADQLSDYNRRDGPQAIYLLSDGDYTTTPFVGNHNAFVADFQGVNRYRRLVVHTFPLPGAGAARSFLSHLATETGGAFTKVLK